MEEEREDIRDERHGDEQVHISDPAREDRLIAEHRDTNGYILQTEQHDGGEQNEPAHVVEQ